MASACMPSSNSTAVQPRPWPLLIISRVRHRSTSNFKLSVPRSGQDSLVHLSHGSNLCAAGYVGILDDDMKYSICSLRRTCADFSSLECHRSTIFGAALKQFSSALSKRPNIFRIVPHCKTSPFPILAQVLGYVHTECTESQQLLRHQIWFGYWIGPEDVDGWGFVEAYLLPI